MRYELWLVHGLIVSGLIGACSVDAVDYRGKSCANGPCPTDLICLPQTLTCEPPSTMGGGSGNSAGGKTGIGGSNGGTSDVGASGGATRSGGTGSGTTGGSSDSIGVAKGGEPGNNGGVGNIGGTIQGDAGGGDANVGGITPGAIATGGAGGVTEVSGGTHAGGTSSAGGNEVGNESGAGGTEGGTVGDPWGGTTERMFYVTAPWQAYYLDICSRSFVASGDDQAMLDFWQHTRGLVESTWGRTVHRALQHFGQCDDPSPHHIEVSLFSTGASSSGLGDPGNGAAQQVNLNIHATDVEILYFFGRALGFKHEYDRQAYTGTCVRCTGNSQCTAGDRTTCLASGYCGNPADHESIMAAPDCGGLESSRKFSAWDALGAQRAYGALKPRTLVDVSGRCLNVGGGTGVPGERMILFPCGQPRGDTFEWTSDDDPSTSDELSAPFTSGSVCLTFAPLISGSSAPQLFTATCDKTAPEQDFHFKSARLRAMGNMCVAATNASVGAELGVYDCAAPQAAPELARWTLHAQAIELEGTGLCINVPANAESGTHLALAPCTAPPPHHLSFDSGLLLIDWNGGGSFAGCVRVADPYPTPGSALVLSASCDSSRREEVFYVSSPIVNSGKCMDHLGLIADDETPVGLVPCTGDAKQEWDYHL